MPLSQRIVIPSKVNVMFGSGTVRTMRYMSTHNQSYVVADFAFISSRDTQVPDKLGLR
jgi:hypothetical protein